MTTTSLSLTKSTIIVGVGAVAVTSSILTVAIQRLIRNRREQQQQRRQPSCLRAGTMAPKRCAGAIKLKPDKYNLYTQLHDAVWEGVLERLYKSNVRNFVVYYHEETNTMFHHFEWIGGCDMEHHHNDDDEEEKQKIIESRFQADMDAIATDPITREWWNYCEQCQEPFSQWPEGLKPPSQQTDVDVPVGDWWAPLKCLCHCGYWPVEYSLEMRDPNFERMNPFQNISTRANPPSSTI